MPSSSEGRSDRDAWEIMGSLWQLGQGVLDESAPEFEAIGLSPKTFFLLSAVDAAPFPAEVARVMHLPPPTVTYMLKQLESIGYIERRAEPGDLRRFRLIVTESGRQAISRARKTAGERLAQRLNCLNTEERACFDRVLKKLGRPSTD
jgi:DNA-binding MarR family transcriptional regulator